MATTTVNPCKEFMLSKAVKVLCCPTSSHHMNLRSESLFHSGPADSPECKDFLSRYELKQDALLVATEVASGIQAFALWMGLSLLLAGVLVGCSLLFKFNVWCRMCERIHYKFTHNTEYVGERPSQEELSTVSPSFTTTSSLTDSTCHYTLPYCALDQDDASSALSPISHNSISQDLYAVEPLLPADVYYDEPTLMVSISASHVPR